MSSRRLDEWDDSARQYDSFEKRWHDELDTFLKIKKKSEQEALSRHGLSYIVDKYLPDKLELLKGN